MPLLCDTPGCDREAASLAQGVDVGGEPYSQLACPDCVEDLAARGAATRPLSEAELDEVSPVDPERLA
jgi:predicted RNA-binding Zn-ribbon protein involved in translation (DUF1610 family)